MNEAQDKIFDALLSSAAKDTAAPNLEQKILGAAEQEGLLIEGSVGDPNQVATSNIIQLELSEDYSPRWFVPVAAAACFLLAFGLLFYVETSENGENQAPHVLEANLPDKVKEPAGISFVWDAEIETTVDYVELSRASKILSCASLTTCVKLASAR